MVTLIPNQLVKLYKTETFNERNKKFHQDYRTYCQIVKQEQTTMFQLAVSETGSELLTGGEFTTDLSAWSTTQTGSGYGWQWAAGQAQGIIGPVFFVDLFQSLNLQANADYVLTVDIDKFVGSASEYLVISAQSGILHELAISRSDYGTTPGVFSLYFNTGAFTHHTIYMNFFGSAGDLVYVNSISLYKLTYPTVTLETCGGSTVKTISALARGNGRISYAVEWNGLDDDCYRICITDTEDTESSLLANALALTTEGDQPIELEDGTGFLKWFG